MPTAFVLIVCRDIRRGSAFFTVFWLRVTIDVGDQYQSHNPLPFQAKRILTGDTKINIARIIIIHPVRKGLSLNAKIRCRYRSGDIQHPLHALHPRRSGCQRFAKRTPTDLSTTRLGRTQSVGNLGTDSRSRPGGSRTRRRKTWRHCRGRYHKPEETTIVWDRRTGKPYYNAIVWQDTRTKDICDQLASEGGQDRFRPKVGLPLATYFSGPKIKWILDHVPGTRESAARGDALFGNIDSWVIWWLTGGPHNGAHVTDVTNASRTMMRTCGRWIGMRRF